VRLKTNIFLWVLLASILPLSILTLAAITYSEKQYLKEVGREVNTSLNNIVSEIDRRLYYERQMILSLANSDSMKQFLPILSSLTRGELHQNYFQLSDRLENFLTNFQGVVPGFRSIRVLDNEGNTLIKVHFGVGYVGNIDGIESTPYAEEEIDTPNFVAQLKEMPSQDLGFMLLPNSRWEVDEDQRGPVMLDAVFPLQESDKSVGYLMVSFSGDLADKILDVVPRLNNGKLLLAELNPDKPARDGMVLYDDDKGIHFKRSNRIPVYLKDQPDDALASMVRTKPDGEFSSANGKIKTYYQEYLPYPNQLASWVIAARVEQETLVEPFDQIRTAMFLLMLTAVGISLVLATIGARNITRPVVELANYLKRFADGDFRLRIKVGGANEIKQMEQSFNYMAETLVHAQDERDNAYKMMMQSAKLASIGEMAAGIGHEINNPLNNSLSLLKLMKRDIGDKDEKLLSDIESLREETLRASSIVKGILNFARQVAPTYSQFDVQLWLRETLDLVQQQARTKHIECHLIAEDGVMLEGDRMQLQQVLVNLLLNAIHASSNNSEIIVSLSRCDGKHLIEVEDHGKGIDEEDMERIFDPFFTTKEVGEGSGLGLSISLGIIERHDGSLKIKNNSDGGVTASVILPCTSGDDDEQ